MLPNTRLRQADIVTSLILVALGVSVIVGALRMPLRGTYGGVPITWYTSPAFFPALLGALLILCAIGVLVRAIAARGHRRLVHDIGAALSHLPMNTAARRILTIWALLLFYILCLVLHPFGAPSRFLAASGQMPLVTFLREPEGMNYVISSFLFLVLFIFRFYRPRGRGWTWTRSTGLLAACGVVAWGIGYVFTQQLYSPLPW